MLDASEDKRTSRVGVRQPKCHELVGVDGSLEGGVTVFPGFKRVHQFDEATWAEVKDAGIPLHDGTSNIIDCFPTDFIIGDDGYGYGFVYRVQRTQSVSVQGGLAYEAADIFIDYYNEKLGSWVRGQQLKLDVPLSPTQDPVNGKQMSVSVFGRFIYVFIENESPVVFYTDRDTYAPVVLANPGPGLQPTLLSPEHSIALGGMVSTGGKAGAGQVRLIDYLPGETGLFNVTSGSGSSGSGSGSGYQETDYPGDDEDARQLVSGDYAFAYVLFSSETGRRSALSEIAQARTADWTDAEAGLTGTPLYAVMEICYDSSKFDQAYIYRSVRVQSAGGTYVASIIHLEKIITLADYQSVNNPLIGSYRQAMYWFVLEDKQLVFQDPFMDRATFDQYMPEGGSSCMYEGTLLVSAITSSASSSSEENRPDDALTGLGELRYSSLSDQSPELFPPGNRYVPNVPSNQIVALKAVGPNAIGFSRDRQYHIRKEGTYIKVQEMHEGFGTLNYRCVDTVGSLVYFATSKGIKAVDTQGALDDVRAINDLIIKDWRDDWDSISVAFDAGLSAFFVLNAAAGEAAVFWFTTAKVTEVHDLPFDLVCRGPWPSNFEYVEGQLASDEGAGNDTYKNPLVERAFFVQNPTRQGRTDDDHGGIWALYQVDQNRENVQGTGSHQNDQRQTLMPFQGNSVFSVSEDYADGFCFVKITATVPMAEPTLCNGCYLYVLKASDPDVVGTKARITKVTASGLNHLINLVVEDGNNINGLREGDIIGISPVYFRWVGSPLGTQDQNEQGQAAVPQGVDFFRVKHASSVGAAFASVEGTALTDVDTSCRHRALLYRGNESTPSYVAQTVDLNNAAVRSVNEDDTLYFASFGAEGALQGKYGVEGAIITPGIEVFVPDLSYELVQVLVTGKMQATLRLGRPT